MVVLYCTGYFATNCLLDIKIEAYNLGTISIPKSDSSGVIENIDSDNNQLNWKQPKYSIVWFCC